VQLHAGNFLEVGCEQVNPDSLNLVGQFGILHHGANRNREHRLLWAVIAPVRLLLRGIPTLASDEPQCGQYGSSDQRRSFNDSLIVARYIGALPSAFCDVNPSACDSAM